mgnify:CR=1 FL=1
MQLNYYLEVLKKYVVFSGRARRAEFWWFTLISTIVSVILQVIEQAIGLDSILSGLYSLGVLLPSIGVAIRRLHDTDRSGWWLLLALIPILGWIALLVFYFQDGDQQPNQYGPSPKYGMASPPPAYS